MLNYERAEGEVLTDEFGNKKFWKAETLVKKEKALLIHPQYDMGNNNAYYFGGTSI